MENSKLLRKDDVLTTDVLDNITFHVVKDLSSLKYCYSDIIRGCIKTVLERLKLGKVINDLSSEDINYIENKVKIVLDEY